MEAELSEAQAAVQTQVHAQPAQNFEPGGIEDAERVVFLALACELARDRSVLVAETGDSALAAVATRVDSSAIDQLSEAESGAVELAVTDVLSPESDLSEFARIVDPETGFAVARFPNSIEFVDARNSFVRGFSKAVTLHQQEWTTSSLFSEAMAQHDHPARAVQSSVRKLAAAQPGEERFHIVVAAHGPLPKLAPQLAVASGSAARERIESQSQLIDQQRVQITALTDRLALAQEDLARAEEQQIPDHSEALAAAEARIAELEAELSWYPENRLPVKAQVEQREWAQSVLAVWRRAVRRVEQLRNRG